MKIFIKFLSIWILKRNIKSTHFTKENGSLSKAFTSESEKRIASGNVSRELKVTNPVLEG